MQPDELYEEVELPEPLSQRYLGLSWNRFFIALVIVLALGIYIGILLFGTNSLEVLLQLEEYENYLKIEIEQLKNENALLQKEYFELKELDADSSAK